MTERQTRSRREFLRTAGAFTTAGLILACTPEESQRSTPTSTRSPKAVKAPSTETPTSTATQEVKQTPTVTAEPERPSPTVEATPEPIKLLETIDIGIPGLVVERYTSKISDITPNMPEELKRSIKEMLAEDSSSLSEFREDHRLMDRVDSSVLFFEYGLGGTIYYNGNSERFYSGLRDGDEEISPETAIAGGNNGISADGKILYRRFHPHPREDPQMTGDIYLLDDTETATKIVLRDTNKKPMVPLSRLRDWDSPIPAPDFEVKLTEDGSKLLVSFFEDPNRKSYLIDVDSWNVQPIDIDNRISYLIVDNSINSYEENLLGPNRRLVPNRDGSLIYAPYTDLLYGYNLLGAIIDTESKKTETVPWPFRLKNDKPHIASQDFNFIAQSVQVGGPYVHSTAAWGTAVRTPEGFFLIDGVDQNIRPERIYDGGNLFASIGGKEALFKLQGGHYHLAETRNGQEVKFDITKG